MKIGFDFGSKNIGYAVLDGEKIVHGGVMAHGGNLGTTLERIVCEINGITENAVIESAGITGSIDLPGVSVFDPVIASVEAARFFSSDCRNILSIGCESFYLVRLDENGEYVEHFVNSDCASGTGSFIDQQAERLGFETGELAEKAAGFDGRSPSIATRCAVFAKSDIIHAQARGFTRESIAAGLCEGVARSVLSNTVRGREVSGTVLFVGGMSRNRKIVQEVRSLIGRDVKVPEGSAWFNAVGAACLGEISWDLCRGLADRVMSGKSKSRKPLDTSLADYPDFSEDLMVVRDGVEVTIYKEPDKENCCVYIGIDVGSTSTKAVVVSTDGTILAGLYGRTKGDPVNAVTTLLGQVKSIYEGRELKVLGVATTGSGRELIREVTGADLAINEITAHARGAVSIDPEVDTIIEIGGQDSKFTLIKDGAVTHAAMNYVCAAGTGSFIEEQAKRLNMELDEISDAVGGKTAPYTSDRCTVYMERDLNIFLSEGWSREEIMAAVLCSVRDNYLSKVVGKSATGKRIYFQGATARNRALVAVFERELGLPVHVSKFCHLTGALGCALTLKEMGWKKTGFTGIDFSCETVSEICTLCSNQCDLRIYRVGDKKTAWGLKCGRDYDDKRVGSKKSGSVIESSYADCFEVVDSPCEKKSVIGIPRTLYMVEYESLFKDFFQRLGFSVVVEKSTDKKLSSGMKMLNADFCAPMALSHGLVESLARKGVDHIFLPSVINEQGYGGKLEREELFREKETDSYFCYYSSYAGTIVGNLPGYDFSGKLLVPRISFNNTPARVTAQRLAKDLSPVLKLDETIIEQAFVEARESFLARKEKWVEKGRDILEKDRDSIKILLLGRPYALFDERINLGIPVRLEQMGFPLLNQGMLDLKCDENQPDHFGNMHWYFGQQILLALEEIRKNPDVYPVFLTCFRCSPDAYLINYFRDFMQKLGKPCLILQLDEHGSDVGYLTRIEAAVDTFKNDFAQRREMAEQPKVKRKLYRPDPLKKGDTVFIPLTDERINRLQKEVFISAGYDAHVIPLDRDMINLGYRYATGGECLPNVAITGSLITAVKDSSIPPEKAILYLPNICLSCNFNQYANLVKLGCDNAGMGLVRVMNTNGLAGVHGLTPRAGAILLSVTLLSSILIKLKYRFQQYEKNAGDTDRAVEKAEEIIENHIRNKKSLLTAAEHVRGIFEKLPLYETRKPRIGILGDLYAKYNDVLNEKICDYAEKLGGEIMLPSYNELVLHAMFADMVEGGDDGKLFNTMSRYEQKFENVFKGLLDDCFEPPLSECHELMEEFGFSPFIAGETAVSLGRMLYYIKHGIVDAVIHVNPVFCCPGVISSSLFRKIQEKYGIPIIDLFYDGTNKPNRMIDPHMFYLTRKALPPAARG